MSEMQNNRRHQAQKELGLDNTEEELQIEQSIQKEELRQMEKQLRRMEIEQSSSYRTSNPQLSSSASFLRLNVLSSLN